jgi:hypothetical protein
MFSIKCSPMSFTNLYQKSSNVAMMSFAMTTVQCLYISWETKWSVPWFDCDESLTCRGFNSNPRHFNGFTFILFHLENRVCLSRGVQVAAVVWWAAMRIVAGAGYHLQTTGDGFTGQVLGGRMIGRSGDAVCGLHCARGYEEHVFLGWAWKPCRWFVSGLASTPPARFI